MLKKFFARPPAVGQAKYASILLIVLVIAQVAVSVVYSNFGGTIRDLEEMAQAVALTNQRLSTEVAKLESLGVVASRAGELGFAPGEVLYLTPQAPVAVKLNGETN